MAKRAAGIHESRHINVVVLSIILFFNVISVAGSAAIAVHVAHVRILVAGIPPSKSQAGPRPRGHAPSALGPPASHPYRGSFSYSSFPRAPVCNSRLYGSCVAYGFGLPPQPRPCTLGNRCSGGR